MLERGYIREETKVKIDIDIKTVTDKKENLK